jgi:hypothetical protein
MDVGPSARDVIHQRYEYVLFIAVAFPTLKVGRILASEPRSRREARREP